MSAEQYRGNRINIRCSDVELKVLDEMCKYYGVGRSEILRATAIARYKADRDRKSVV